MANETALTAADSVFLKDIAESDRHVVDQLIEERCPTFVDHWSWMAVKPTLHTLLGYDKARVMADDIRPLGGHAAFEYLSDRLKLRTTVHHIERFPPTGKLIIAVNHPTGLADGVAVWDILKTVRRDVVFFANADALRVGPGFVDTVIPVEWVLDKRSTAKTKETLRRTKQAFEDDQCVVIFPSGKLAKMENGRLTEKDWFTTVVSLARKQNVPVLPLNIKARNSRLFYTLSNINGELRDITLFYELLNKTGSRFEMTFGPMIPPDALAGDPQTVTDRLKAYVSYDLPHETDRAFDARLPQI